MPKKAMTRIAKRNSVEKRRGKECMASEDRRMLPKQGGGLKKGEVEEGEETRRVRSVYE